MNPLLLHDTAVKSSCWLQAESCTLSSRWAFLIHLESSPALKAQWFLLQWALPPQISWNTPSRCHMLKNQHNFHHPGHMVLQTCKRHSGCICSSVKGEPADHRFLLSFLPYHHQLTWRFFYFIVGCFLFKPRHIRKKKIPNGRKWQKTKPNNVFRRAKNLAALYELSRAADRKIFQLVHSTLWVPLVSRAAVCHNSVSH